MIVWLFYEFNKFSGGLPDIERTLLNYLRNEDEYLYNNSIFINVIWDLYLENKIYYYQDNKFIDVFFNKLDYNFTNKELNKIFLKIGIKNIDLIIMNEVIYTDIKFISENNLKLKYIIHNFEYCITNKIIYNEIKKIINYVDVITISEHYKKELNRYDVLKNKKIKFFVLGLDKYNNLYSQENRDLYKKNKIELIKKINLPLTLNFTSRLDFQKNIDLFIDLLKKYEKDLQGIIYYSDNVQKYKSSLQYLKEFGKLKNVKFIYENNYNQEKELFIMNNSLFTFFISNFEPAGLIQYKSLFMFTVCLLPDFITNDEFNPVYRLSLDEFLELIKCNLDDIKKYYLNFINDSNYFDYYFEYTKFKNIILS